MSQEYRLIEHIHKLRNSIPLQKAIYKPGEVVGNPDFELRLEQALRTLNVQLVQVEKPLYYSFDFEERILMGLYPHNLESLWWMLINLAHLVAMPTTTQYGFEFARYLGSEILYFSEFEGEWYNTYTGMEKL